MTTNDQSEIYTNLNYNVISKQVSFEAKLVCFYFVGYIPNYNTLKESRR